MYKSLKVVVSISKGSSGGEDSEPAESTARDFMEFTEPDEDTLQLSVNDSGILGMLSITTDYEIRGKTL